MWTTLYYDRRSGECFLCPKDKRTEPPLRTKRDRRVVNRGKRQEKGVRRNPRRQRGVERPVYRADSFPSGRGLDAPPSSTPRPRVGLARRGRGRPGASTAEVALLDRSDPLWSPPGAARVPWLDQRGWPIQRQRVLDGSGRPRHQPRDL